MYCDIHKLNWQAVCVFCQIARAEPEARQALAIDPARWTVLVSEHVSTTGDVSAVYADAAGFYLFALGTLINDPEGQAVEWHTISEPVRAGNARAAA